MTYQYRLPKLLPRVLISAGFISTAITYGLVGRPIGAPEWPFSLLIGAGLLVALLGVLAPLATYSAIFVPGLPDDWSTRALKRLFLVKVEHMDNSDV